MGAMNGSRFAVDDDVLHRQFGVGKVVASMGERITARFQAGPKTVLQAFLEPVKMIQGQGQGFFKPRPFEWINPEQIPPRRWLLDRHLIRQFISVMGAPGGVGKTNLIIADSLALATGRNLVGHQPHGRHNVLIWNGEDPLEELQRRIMAACMVFGIERHEIEGRLFVNSGREDPITVATVERSGVRIATPTVEAFKAGLRANGIGAWFIDPFVSSHSVPENDNGAIDAVAKTWGRIAGETDTAGELVHHVKKLGGNEVQMEDLRGAVALLAAARSGRVLNTMNTAEAEKWGVSSAERRLYFREDNGKGNLAPPPAEGAAWFRQVSQMLPNGRAFGGVQLHGDSVGVVTAWQPPNAMENVTVSHLREVQRRMAQSGPWRESVQSPDWAGNLIGEVMGLDPASPKDRTTIKAALKAWLASGMFKVKMIADEGRRERKCIVVGEIATD